MSIVSPELPELPGKSQEYPEIFDNVYLFFDLSTIILMTFGSKMSDNVTQ